jgi:hypothetical protein
MAFMGGRGKLETNNLIITLPAEEPFAGIGDAWNGSFISFHSGFLSFTVFKIILTIKIW